MTVLARLIRKGKENPVVLSIAMAVICYGAQALVNISVPIVAPVLFTLMAMDWLPAGMKSKIVENILKSSVLSPSCPYPDNWIIQGFLAFGGIQ